MAPPNIAPKPSTNTTSNNHEETSVQHAVPAKRQAEDVLSETPNVRRKSGDDFNNMNAGFMGETQDNLPKAGGEGNHNVQPGLNTGGPPPNWPPGSYLANAYIWQYQNAGYHDEDEPMTRKGYILEYPATVQQDEPIQVRGKPRFYLPPGQNMPGILNRGNQRLRVGGIMIGAIPTSPAGQIGPFRGLHIPGVTIENEAEFKTWLSKFCDQFWPWIERTSDTEIIRRDHGRDSSNKKIEQEMRSGLARHDRARRLFLDRLLEIALIQEEMKFIEHELVGLWDLQERTSQYRQRKQAMIAEMARISELLQDGHHDYTN